LNLAAFFRIRKWQRSSRQRSAAFKAKGAIGAFGGWALAELTQLYEVHLNQII